MMSVNNYLTPGSDEMIATMMMIVSEGCDVNEASNGDIQR